MRLSLARAHSRASTGKLRTRASAVGELGPGHGLVARRDLKPGERFTDPLVVAWAHCRGDAERGRTIDSLRDLESEKVIKADGYSSGWSLRDLDDDESWRRDHSGPCSLLWVLAIRARSPG